MRLMLLSALALPIITGCATVDTVKDTATRMAQLAKAHAEQVYQRQQHYLSEHELLKTFEDASEHSEAEVLKVLHAARAPGAPAANAPIASTPGTRSAANAKPSSGTSTARGAPNVNGSFHWPVEAGVISSDYGARWGKMHKGIDIAADIGEPVYAVADGEVIYAGDGLRGYGNVVIIQHGQRMSSLYAHNSELRVKQGDHVAQGTLVALMGNTGHSTGPHVHFELRQGDAAVNPRTLLPAATLADATNGGSEAKQVSALSARR